MNYRHVLLAAAGAVALLQAPAATAQTAAFVVTGTPGALANPPFTLGYAFSTDRSFTVTSLGVLDADADGLAQAHDIGLWNATGSLLASTTVGAGTAGTLVGGFRYSAITGLTIAAGTYRIGALFLSGADPVTFPEGASATPATDGFTYLSSQFAGGGTLTDPTATTGGPTSGAYFGPNLLVTAVPEPAAWAMMIGGFGLIGGTLRRRSANVRTSVAYA